MIVIKVQSMNWKYIMVNVTHHFRGNVLVQEGVVEIVGLADVEAGVDLHLEILAVGVVKQTIFFVKFNGLPLFPLFENVPTSGITDWWLQINRELTSFSRPFLVKTYSVLTASSVANTQTNVTLIIDGRCIGKSVSLEAYQGSGFTAAILEFAHDFPIFWTALLIKEVLLAPSEAVTDDTAADVHPVDILVVYRDYHCQRITKLDILSDPTLQRLTPVNLHARARHGSRRHQRRGLDATEVKEKAIIRSHIYVVYDHLLHVELGDQGAVLRSVATPEMVPPTLICN